MSSKVTKKGVLDQIAQIFLSFRFKRRAVPRVKASELTKLYYPIGEVAKMFGVNSSLLRFWEKEFEGLAPKKNSKGNRVFTPKEIAKLDRIYELVKEKGYTLDGAKKALLNKEEVNPEKKSVASSLNNEELISRLEKVRQDLLKLKS